MGLYIIHCDSAATMPHGERGVFHALTVNLNCIIGNEKLWHPFSSMSFFKSTKEILI
jgi:hypothetical protein